MKQHTVGKIILSFMSASNAFGWGATGWLAHYLITQDTPTPPFVWVMLGLLVALVAAASVYTITQWVWLARQEMRYPQ